MTMSKQLKENEESMVFSKKNYILMGIGIFFITLGLILLSGGGSKDPSVFNEEIFNSQRMVIAPLLMVGGFVIEIFAIMRKDKKEA